MWLAKRQPAMVLLSGGGGWWWEGCVRGEVKGFCVQAKGKETEEEEGGCKGGGSDVVC